MLTPHEVALLEALDAHYHRWTRLYELGGVDSRTAARWAVERTLRVEERYLRRCGELGRSPWDHRTPALGPDEPPLPSAPESPDDGDTA